MSTAIAQQQKVERAFLAALNLVSGAGTGALTDTRLLALCENDHAACQEVANLLGHAAQADKPPAGRRGFLDPGELHQHRSTVTFAMGDWREIIIGQAVSHFVITSEIGAGGMGIVYEARDTNLRRSVALKFLRPSYARDPETRSRFLREARIASVLNHPHICTIYSLNEYNEHPFVAMEFVEGKTLRALANESIELDRVIRLMEQTGQALDAAHKMGVVHRDIKPENLMVREDDWIKVLDFGVARLFPDVLQGARAETATASGVLIGTTRYMSPEQARCEESIAASDIFSLGIVFYELITGQHPFESSRGIAVLEAITSQPAVSPRVINAEILPDLETLLLQMLDKSPQHRPTAEEVVARLQSLDIASSSNQQSTTPPPRRTWVGRVTEQEILQKALADAVDGRGTVLCVTGEAGIGKTSLVEELLSGLTAQQPCLIARGRCSEQLTGTEAYLPILEALADLQRSPDGATAARVMKAAAPAWHALLHPGNESTTGVSHHAPIGARLQERLKLELISFLQEIGRTKTVILFLDDLHCADISTIDLLLYLGGKCPSLRVLVIVTYRPVDLLLSKHPFHAVKLELEARSQCQEIQLNFLRPEDADAYLSILFPNNHFPESFRTQLHSQTSGNPLFLTDLTRHLRDSKVIVEQAGKWTLAPHTPDWQTQSPPSIRSLIEKTLNRLPDPDRKLLVAASVQGTEFDVAVIAKALQQDAAEVEERMEQLDRVYSVVRMVKEHQLPDGTLTVRFAFVHLLYQQALYKSLQPTRRAALTAAVAEAMRAFNAEGNLEE